MADSTQIFSQCVVVSRRQSELNTRDIGWFPAASYAAKTPWQKSLEKIKQRSLFAAKITRGKPAQAPTREPGSAGITPSKDTTIKTTCVCVFFPCAYNSAIALMHYRVFCALSLLNRLET